jgi:hypothetical protein
MKCPYILFTIILCLFIISFSPGCLEDNNGKIFKMDFEEFINDYRQDNDNTSGEFRGWYLTLDKGDTVIIHDTIKKMSYSDTYDTTYVEFSSIEGRTVQFPVEGDLWTRFQEGEDVEITLHIIHVKFTQQITSGENMSVNIETYDEGWDNTNNIHIPVPHQYIHPA